MARDVFHWRGLLSSVALLVLGVVWTGEWRSAQARTSVAILPTGDGLELQYGDGSERDRTTIPVYRVGDVRYFSAGVGLEEREADYPAFSLKIVLVVGGKPYLTQVPVTIADESGSVKLTIPKERVTGPWLFVDLPPGTYQVSAIWQGQTQMNRTVKTGKGVTTTVHLRWPDRPGH